MTKGNKQRVYIYFAAVAICVWFVVAPHTTVGQESPGKDKLVVETLLRLKRYDVSGNEKWKAAVGRHLQTIKGTPPYLDLVKAFGVTDAIPDLLELAISSHAETIGVNAASVLLDFKQSALLLNEINGGDSTRALAIAGALSLSAHPAGYTILKPIVT